MVWDRKQRWEAILQEKVAVIVQQRLSDPRLGFITITRTELSRDKRICYVYFTVLGTDSQRSRSQRALANSAPRVLELLAPTLRMRSLPELRFVHDDAIKRESRVLDLINEVTEERKAREEALDLTEPDDDESGADDAGDGREPDPEAPAAGPRSAEDESGTDEPRRSDIPGPQ